MKKLLYLFTCVTLFGQLFAQNPFRDLGIKESDFLTLSDGRYDEFHSYNDFERVGSAIIDMRTKKITYFIDRVSVIDDGMAELDMTTRFLTIDPMAEKFSQMSPYAYCLNNPIKYIDPTGLAPIYDPSGNLIGTDDNGLQGDAIIMNQDNFKQGMSFDDASKYDLGIDGLADKDAVEQFNNSFNGLKDRPDYDGYLTLNEANDWYQNGDGQPLFVALDKIDLSGVYSLGEKHVDDEKNINLLLSSSSVNDGLVFGSITLKRYPNNSVRAYSDIYDFEMHNPLNPLNWGRNTETVIGRKVAGQGSPYDINLYGSKKLKPLLPWLK